MIVLKSRLTLAVLMLGVAIVVAFASYGAATGAGTTTGGPHDALRVVSAESDYTFEVEDERKLVGFGQNVFFGRVVERVGTEELPTSGPGPGIPQTQFAVEVQENVKGKLAGTVTVNQFGGVVQGTNTLELVEGDPLLEPGQEYLFVTRYDQGKNRHLISAPPYGKVKVKDAADKKALKDKFEKAKTEEIPYDPNAPQGPPDQG